MLCMQSLRGRGLAHCRKAIFINIATLRIRPRPSAGWRYVLIFVFCLLFSTPADAACSNPSGSAGNTVYNADYNVLQFCNGTNWRAIGSQNFYLTFTDQTDVAGGATITSDTLTIPAGHTNETATCGTGCTTISINGGAFVAGPVTGINAGDTIAIRQTSSASASTTTTAVVTVGALTSATWRVKTACTVAPGGLCADGSVYAGLSPDGNVPMYTTPQDRPLASGSCWNDCNCTNYTTTSLTSAVTGKSNSATLITLDSDSGTGGTQPHRMAQYCEDLVAHGQSDWYMPALNELDVLYTNKAAIGNFDTSGSFYWSSTEFNTNDPWVQQFSGGSQNSGFGKCNSFILRCVRR